MNTITDTNSRQRVGILGGTFDPIHYGHIKPAMAVAAQLNLDELTLMPAHIPPHKQGTHACATHRLNMAKLMAKEFSSVAVDDRELNRDTPSFTAETLAQMTQERPDIQLFFLVGMDSLLTFTRWHKWQDILSYCHLVVSIRPGYDSSALSTEDQKALAPFFCQTPSQLMKQKAGCIYLVKQPSVDVSSTAIRIAVANNNFDVSLQPKSVIDYIKRHNLYR